MTDAAPPPTAQSDWLLEMLVGLADSEDVSVAITLWTSAGLVAGDLVGAPRWIRELLAGVRSDGDEAAQHFAEKLQPVEEAIDTLAETAHLGPQPLQLVHLRNAVTLLPSGESFRHGLWRGRFSDIAGWTLGKP